MIWPRGRAGGSPSGRISIPTEPTNPSLPYPRPSEGSQRDNWWDFILPVGRGLSLSRGRSRLFPSEPVILPHRRDLICIGPSDNSPLVPRQFVRAQRHLVAGHGGLRRRLWSRPASHAGPEAPANIATGPRWSQLCGGPARMHCPTRVKNDGNVRGTRITNTGLHDMGGILSLNKRGPAAVPGSPDHNGEPLVTVVVLNQVGIIRATRGKASQTVCISGQNAPVTAAAASSFQEAAQRTKVKGHDSIQSEHRSVHLQRSRRDL